MNFPKTHFLSQFFSYKLHVKNKVTANSMRTVIRGYKNIDIHYLSNGAMQVGLESQLFIDRNSYIAFHFAP